MAETSNVFVEESTLLSDELGDRTEAARHALEEEGFIVVQGLTRAYAHDVVEMAQQPHIQAYYPNDSGDRFRSVEAIEARARKKERVYSLLVNVIDEDIDTDDPYLPLYGYGWAGPGDRAGELVYAQRMGKSAQGRGLDLHFGRVILSDAFNRWGAQKVCVQAWATNRSVLDTYRQLGFEEDSREPQERRSGFSARQRIEARLHLGLDLDASFQ